MGLIQPVLLHRRGAICNLRLMSSGKSRPYTFIDLFAGMGGFHIAFNQTKRARCVFASEWDPAARKTYKHNFNKRGDRELFKNNDQYFGGDITDPKVREKIRPFKILCGGFPCQPFSQAGRKKGFDDTRGTLFFTIQELIKEHSPEVFFLENVRGLIRHGGTSRSSHTPPIGKTLETILERLFDPVESGGLGYHKPAGTLGYFQVKASDYGVPQHRPRVFIIGFKRPEVARRFVCPSTKNLSETKLSKVITAGLDDANPGDTVTYDKAGERIRKIGFTLRCGGKGSAINDRRNWEHYYLRNAKTGRVRVVRINEEIGLRLNGFPNNYVFPPVSEVPVSARLKQLGNSVAVPAVRAWAQAIIDALDHGKQRRA